jgi:D-tyrosyl-tRNA(Tyr) deacylase
MRVIVQRVSESSVTINNKVISIINHGYNLLVGFKADDNEQIIDQMINKIIKLRIFEDQANKMNLSITDVKGSVLLVSQFTLYADSSSGNRPSFKIAAPSSIAKDLYNYMFKKLSMMIEVKTGEFGADMSVLINNNGPLTIILDSDNI